MGALSENRTSILPPPGSVVETPDATPFTSLEGGTAADAAPPPLQPASVGRRRPRRPSVTNAARPPWPVGSVMYREVPKELSVHPLSLRDVLRRARVRTPGGRRCQTMRYLPLRARRTE